MSKVFRWAGYGIGGLLVLAVLAAAYLWIASSRALGAATNAVPETLVQPTPAALADAERRARTLGCTNCHGEGFVGRKFVDIPNVATIHSTNLSLLAQRASSRQLAQAIRQGIGSDGRPLLAMPSEAYQFLTDEETAALVALLKRQPPKGTAQPRPSLGPLGRVGVVSGDFSTAPVLVAEYKAKPAVDLGGPHRLGRHLAMTTCSGCHGSDLSGRQMSPDAIAPSLDMVGAYDLPAFTRLLREGVAPGTKKLGLMREAALNDTRYYTDREIAAIHAYLVARAQR